MTDRQEHDEIDLVLPDYVLGLVDRTERLRIELHLAACPECRSRVAGDRIAFAHLLVAPPRIEAPGHVRARIVERCATLATQGDPTTSASTPEPEAGPAAQGRRHFPRGLIVAAIVPWIAVAALVASIIVPRPTSHMMVIAVVGRRGAHAMLVGMNTDRKAYLLVARMPPVPANERYVCWLERPGSMDRACAFHGAHNGMARIPVAGARPLGDYARIVVMLERGAPGASPSGTVLAAASFS